MSISWKLCLDLNQWAVSINIAAFDGSYSEDVGNVFLESSIPARYPSVDTDIHKYPHLTDVLIATVCRGSPVEILTGMDNPYLIAPLDARPNSGCMKDPFATKTFLAWALDGHDGGNALNGVSSYFVQPMGWAFMADGVKWFEWWQIIFCWRKWGYCNLGLLDRTWEWSLCPFHFMEKW